MWSCYLVMRTIMLAIIRMHNDSPAVFSGWGYQGKNFYYSTIGKNRKQFFIYFSLYFSLPSRSLSINYYYAPLCQGIIGQTFKATHGRLSYVKTICLKKFLSGFTGMPKGVKHTWTWQIAMWRSIRNHKAVSIVYWILNRSWEVKSKYGECFV